MERRKYRISDIISVIVSCITLCTLVVSMVFWFFKTDALPARVEKTEKRLDDVETELIKNSTKTDLIYQGVIEIRSVLLRGEK